MVASGNEPKDERRTRFTWPASPRICTLSFRTLSVISVYIACWPAATFFHEQMEATSCQSGSERRTKLIINTPTLRAQSPLPSSSKWAAPGARTQNVTEPSDSNSMRYEARARDPTTGQGASPRSRWPSLAAKPLGTGPVDNLLGTLHSQQERVPKRLEPTPRRAASPASRHSPPHSAPSPTSFERAPAPHLNPSPRWGQPPHFNKPPSRDAQPEARPSASPSFAPRYQEATQYDQQDSRPAPAKSALSKSRPAHFSRDQVATRGKPVKDRHAASQIEEPSKPAIAKVKKVWKPVEKRITEDVYIPSTVTVENLARLLGVRLEDLQDKMYMAGMESQASFDYVLTSDYAVLLAEEMGRRPIVNDEAAFDLFPPSPHPNPETLPTRPPVVTIMGHVDHGKTTLLDTLRSSSVAKGEVGGITQHIGAFSVPLPSPDPTGPQSITFLDTPGHAAFSAMRARGAQVTDIIVLVVAADDGIMPQTREVIELIKKDRDHIGVVVAINKIDKHGSNPEAVQKALLVEGIQLEDYGGDTPAVQVSGLTGKGLPDLLDTLSLISEIQDLRAESDGPAFGYVLESKVVKGLGPIATVLVLRGTLKAGAHILSGLHHGKVRMMHDSNGKLVKNASPGMAITVSGWKSLPNAGDEVLQGAEGDVKKAIANRQRKADMQASLADVQAINASRKLERDRRQVEAAAAATAAASPNMAKVTQEREEGETGPKELRLVIKADVSGSAEAVEGALQGIGNHLAMTKVISSGVGPIMESDIMMAKAIGGTVVGFSVPSSRAIETLAGQHNVPIISSDIIYRLMERVKDSVIALLPVTYESKVLGEAKVLQLFEITVKGKKLKTVAGSRVLNGVLDKTKQARVVRDGKVIHEGTFETMRHFKKDVAELRKGTECGLNLTEFNDLQVDDVIQGYEIIEKPGVL
ncbi:unnamed protein product [Mycena citricolor]|uniref:Translation initiation factor IF-2, mitochondrial n=1 Tax=Mycena citricolor TaxID=2018698 RepID=A0AAD2HNY4_9AGAR|nr:unnamed protein product [Mycena citricolor]